MDLVGTTLRPLCLPPYHPVHGHFPQLTAAELVRL